MENNDLLLFYENITKLVKDDKLTQQQNISLHIFKEMFNNDTFFKSKSDEDIIHYLFLGWYINNYINSN